MGAQIFYTDEVPLTDGSTVFNVLLQDRTTGATITISAISESHAHEIGKQLLLAGFNSER